jgi:hypothetical protein
MSPARDTSAGRAYLDLQRQARSTKRPVQELFQLYVLEGFLDRLSRSAERGAFVVKGGVLLAAFDLRRPTRDIDLQAETMSNNADEVLDRVVQIANFEIDDGIVFDSENAAAIVIRDEDAYSGIRVTIPASLDRANLPFHVDVSVGGPIYPEPNEVALPRLLGGTISVRGYPLALVHAEKIVTAVSLGTLNTRWRDFVDVVGLAAQHEVSGDELTTALNRVAAHRGVELVSLEGVLAGYSDIAQAKWAAWRRKQDLADRTPAEFSQLVDDFASFADPAIIGSVGGLWWNPAVRAWI